MIRIILSLLIALCVQIHYSNAVNLDEAETFFKAYVNKAHNYDSEIVDMYANNALIKRKLLYKDGHSEDIIISTDKFLSKLKLYRFLAKIRGYKNYYIDIRYTQECENIRITGKRQPVMWKKEFSKDYVLLPFSFLLKTDDTGNIKIIEDYTHTYSVFLVK